MTKKELRVKIKNKLDLLPVSYIDTAGETIESRVISSDIFKKSESIFIYINMPKEPSTLSIISEALKLNKKVLIPKCVSEGIMSAVEITGLDELKPGAFGIKEPVSNEESKDAKNIDLAIVPCVTASRNGMRLGHGGGYYDRFLEKHDIFKLCLCFEEIMCEEIPVSDNDIKMNAVFTEKNEYNCEV